MAELGATSGHFQWNGVNMESVPSRCSTTGVTIDMLRLEPDMRTVQPMSRLSVRMRGIQRRTDGDVFPRLCRVCIPRDGTGRARSEYVARTGG